MKYYLQFYHVVDDKLQEICGSDGVWILDGRSNMRTMKCEAQRRIYELRNVQKIVGYKILKGERFSDSNQCLYTWTRSGCLPEHRDRHELQ